MCYIYVHILIYRHHKSLDIHWILLDSPVVDPRSNPGSGSAFLMSEKSQAVYYISSCHNYANRQSALQWQAKRSLVRGWLAYFVNVMRSPVIERLMVRGSQVALKHVIHDMEARTLVMELRRRAIKRWVPCGDMDRRLKIPHSAKAECGFGQLPRNAYTIAVQSGHQYRAS